MQYQIHKNEGILLVHGAPAHRVAAVRTSEHQIKLLLQKQPFPYSF
jgi:hypothetical protein